jgi:nitronate monooxygenase
LPDAPVHAFDGDYCALIEEVRPEVVSFHFGLPDASLIERVLATDAKVISSATTIAEARWLAANGCDAIIAQGLEAGGHRGTFTSDDISTQVGTFALVPQIVDAVKVPVIAAGGIADARGIAAAFALGASAVQIGTAYLLCPEVNLPAVHRKALEHAQDDSTALTNVFSGRPARAIVNRVVREMGPMASGIPQFPLSLLKLQLASRPSFTTRREAPTKRRIQALFEEPDSAFFKVVARGPLTEKIAGIPIRHNNAERGHSELHEYVVSRQETTM